MSDKRDSIGRSRVFFDGLLPGNIYRIRHTLASGRVIGVRDNREESSQVDEAQLVSVARRIVQEWGSMPNCVVDQGLLQALEKAASKIVIVSPGEITITPFPMMMKCEKCHVLDYLRQNMNDDDKIRDAASRLKKRGNRYILPCKRPGCSGHMLQLPYVAVHRCGHMDQIDISPRDWSLKNLGFRDSGGTFLESSFFDVDSRETRSRALQMPCQYCKKLYGDQRPGVAKRGTPIRNQEKFYPQNIQYLCLNAETGSIVARAQAILGASKSTMSDHGKDIAEGLVSALIGISTPGKLMKHLHALFEGQGKDEKKLELLQGALEEKQAERANKEMEAKAANIPESFIADILRPYDTDIAALVESLVRASGAFTKVRQYVGDDEILRDIAKSRRSFEAALIGHDFIHMRDTLADIINRETDTIRKEELIGTASVIASSYGIKEILHYKEVNVVMASIGYTREKFRPGEDMNEIPVALAGYEDIQQHSLHGKRILYALPAKTEAIQIRLDPRNVLRWWIEAMGVSHPGDETLNDEIKARTHLLNNCPALFMDPADVIRETKERPLKESAPFHMLHTISHVLMANIKRHTGYDDKSVMEYLLPMDLSILFYVTSVQNYTAGGLYTLFKHYLRQWFDDASNYALSCMMDPFCSDKGSTCSRCVQIVIGCETFNHGISRSYIHGGKTGEDNQIIVNRGYWS